MRSILFVHQSAELYGSDKTLLFLVKDLHKYKIKPLVVLPHSGPLSEFLIRENIQVIFNPVIKLSRSTFSVKNLLHLPMEIFSSVKSLKKLLGNESIELIHSNTLAVLLGAFYAKKMKIKHVWHVHEIIEKPKFVSKIYRILLNYYADHIVFNSFATKQSWAKTNESLDLKSSVIYNGILKPNTSEVKLDVIQINQNHAIRPNHLVIGLVGRISRWKGQALLLNAFEILHKKYPNLLLLYLGSPPPNQEFFLENLEKEVESKHLKNSVRIIPYTENIWDYWRRIDIAVVPSTEPEPFGLVAVEAMLSAKPVVVAGHGGLTEIIEHEKTGILFKPNDVLSLTEQLETLIQDPEKRKRLGENGKLFAESRFTNQTYVESFFNLYEKLLTDE